MCNRSVELEYLCRDIMFFRMAMMHTKLIRRKRRVF
jgi:hypothetical protein